MAGKSVHLAWGIVSVLAGALFGFTVVRLLFRAQWTLAAAADRWSLAGLVPLGALAAFLVWLGKRQLGRAGGDEVGKPRVRWGRLVLGLWIAFYSVKGHFSPRPHALKANNEEEAAGMLAAMVVITALGLSLMASAFKPTKSKLAPASSENDAAGRSS